MTLDNPYAPPVPVAGAEDLSPRHDSDFQRLDTQTVIIRALAASAATAVGVLLYQFYRDLWQLRSTPLTSWQSLFEGASFSSAAFFTALAFAVPWGRPAQRRCVVTVVMFSVLACLLFVLGMMLVRNNRYQLIFFLIFPGSQMATVAAIGWIQRVPIRFDRLIVAGIAGFAAWLALTIAAVGLLVRHLSGPFDDFAGYTLLTVFWCWTVAGQIAFVIRYPRNSLADSATEH